MKILIHDLDKEFEEKIKQKFDLIIFADGKYGMCLGCFDCWTKNPATCKIKDSLHEIARIIGQAEDMVIITKNCYGGFSPQIKNILDRAIGTSTPLSTYRKGEMHHTLRYGKHNKWSVFVYGDILEKERKTWKLLLERNAVNGGFGLYEIFFEEKIDDIGKVLQ